MTKLFLVLFCVSLPFSAFASDDLNLDAAKTEGKKTVQTVKKDHKKIAKSAKSEAKSAWAKTKSLLKKK